VVGEVHGGALLTIVKHSVPSDNKSEAKQSRAAHEKALQVFVALYVERRGKIIATGREEEKTSLFFKTYLEPEFAPNGPHDHLPFLLLHKIAHIVGPVTTVLLQPVHTIARGTQPLSPLLHLPLHVRPVTFLLAIWAGRRWSAGSSSGTLSALRLAHLRDHPFTGRAVWTADQNVHVARGDVLGPADPLEIGDGGSGGDCGFWVEEPVTALRQCLTCSPDIEHGHLARARPTQDISRGRNDGVAEPLDVEDVADLGLANFFQGREGISPGTAVAEETHESDTTVIASCDSCRIAEEFVEISVGAFCTSGLEDMDAGFSCDD
jgi:hypothetical protein